MLIVVREKYVVRSALQYSVAEFDMSVEYMIVLQRMGYCICAENSVHWLNYQLLASQTE